MSLDFTLPEVKTNGTAARFYNHKGKDMAEVSVIGTKDSISLKVTPELMAQYKREWDAYCDGKPMENRPGTPLTDLPSITEERAKEYIYRNVHNLEELAALSDAQCQGVGHGAMTERKHAVALVLSKQAARRDQLQREVQDKQATVGATVEANELEAVKADVAELKTGIAQILELLAKPKSKGGRPKKEKVVD